MTLVEVVIGLVLLATLVGGVLVAFGRHQRQVRLAEQRLQAARAADDLLATFYQGGKRRLVAPSQGILQSAEGSLIWRTSIARQALVDDLPVHVVRLELFAESESRAGQPLVQVELLQPNEEAEIALRERIEEADQRGFFRRNPPGGRQP